MQSRWDMARINPPEELPNNVVVLENTKQIMGIHTIIRDINTSRHDFIFYADRLATLVIERYVLVILVVIPPCLANWKGDAKLSQSAHCEHIAHSSLIFIFAKKKKKKNSALNELPYESKNVITPTGKTVDGLSQKALVAGVSILRAGGTMENGLRRVIRDAVIGKILIQTDPSNGEPQLHYCKLPPAIVEENTYIFLMDAVVGTGAAGLMAIRVLLDHNVPQERILFLSFLACPQGVHTIANAFPKVKIVTSFMDPVLNAETLFLEPGLGNFGDRYFGTENE